MPILRPVGNRREQPKCICTRQYRDPECPAVAPAVKVVEIKIADCACTPKCGSLPMAIVKLPRFGLLARAKRSYGDWRRKRLERYKAKRAAELQMLKELEHSSESVLRPFRRLVMLLFGGSLLDRD